LILGRRAARERHDGVRLARENAELRRANEFLKAASVFRGGARPDPATVMTFIDEHSGRFAVALWVADATAMSSSSRTCLFAARTRPAMHFLPSARARTA